MATVSHLFAGITDYFKAYGAKSFADVQKNANKRFNPAELTRQRAENVSAFRAKLNQNENLSASQVHAMAQQRNARHAVGDFFENSFGLVGKSASLVGGTVGYATKKTAQAAFGTAVAGTKMGFQATSSAVRSARAARQTADPIPGQLALTGPVKQPRQGMPDELQMAAQSAPYVIKPTARAVGQGLSEYGKNLGQDAWRGAKWFHENRNSRGMVLGTTAATMALMPAAYNGGQLEAANNHHLQGVASNMAVSNDGGGTFLRQNQTPQVQDMGATGDLVFALHSLRNGG